MRTRTSGRVCCGAVITRLVGSECERTHAVVFDGIQPGESFLDPVKPEAWLRERGPQRAANRYLGYAMTSSSHSSRASTAHGPDLVGGAERRFLRHTLATLAYRAEKPLRDAPNGFAALRPEPGTRAPGEILAHMCDLLDWALRLARGTDGWRAAPATTWEAECERFFAALEALDAYVASDAPLGRTAAALFQGPIADALTHTGQLCMLRRLAGAPVRAENYVTAEIQVGRLGPDQSGARVEFD
jgi:hypothetical protein